MTVKAKTVGEYLDALDDDKRSALQDLRKIIKNVAPKAEECISYQMPAFRIDGKVLLWYGAGANHCAFYPGGIVEQYKAELEGYSISKGTIRFQPNKPLPASLVRKLVMARIENNKNRKLNKEEGQKNNLPERLAKPAMRALQIARYRNLEQLANINIADLKHLHGIGPNAIVVLLQALNSKGLSFAKKRKTRS